MLTVNSQGHGNPMGKPGVARPLVVHPDYPHCGDLAPPFNVSADSIIYMDLDELDDFFLRQKRKPEVGFHTGPRQRLYSHDHEIVPATNTEAERD